MREVGELSRAWKGNEAGYVAKHMWISKHYGKANKCIKCGGVAKRYEWANISGEYRRDISDYMMLCPSCHRKMDHGEYCKRGHKYTKQNTYIRKEGWRCCRVCMSIARNKYYKNAKRD